MAASVPQGSSAKPSFNQLVQLAKLSGQKPPSTWSVLDNTLGAVTGFKPSMVGKGLYDWRHPIAQYQKAQRATAPSMGMLPITPGGGLFKFLDVEHPGDMTMWHNGPPRTIADTNKMLGAEGNPFHLHAVDRNGDLVAAMHGAHTPTNIHISSVFTDPASRGKGLAGTMHAKVLSSAAKNGMSVSSDYENTALGNSIGKLAMKQGFKVHVDPQTLRTHFYKPMP